MPNWTSNTIRVTGDPSRIRAFRDEMASESQSFDFNRLIPMPGLLKRTGCGSRIIDGKKLSSWRILSEGIEGEIPEEVRPFTPEEESALREIGHFNWYDWACANWGTKWNAACVSVTATTLIDPDAIEITFDTAWSPPLPVFDKMIEDYPDLCFECRWVNEDEPDIEHALTSGAFDIGDDE
jgi:hypothetical protein